VIRVFTAEILFLDIQMPGMTGFDLLEKIDGVLPETTINAIEYANSRRTAWPAGETCEDLSGPALARGLWAD
jgi:DNA-binding NtrC family response regulator